MLFCFLPLLCSHQPVLLLLKALSTFIIKDIELYSFPIIQWVIRSLLATDAHAADLAALAVSDWDIKGP